MIFCLQRIWIPPNEKNLKNKVANYHIAHCSEIQYKDGQGLNSFWQSNFGAKLNLKCFDLYFKPHRNSIYKWSTMRSSLKAQETTFMVITEQRPLWTNLTK